MDYLSRELILESHEIILKEDENIRIDREARGRRRISRGLKIDRSIESISLSLCSFSGKDRSSVPFEWIFETFGTRLKLGSRQVSSFVRDIISGGSQEGGARWRKRPKWWSGATVQGAGKYSYTQITQLRPGENLSLSFNDPSSRPPIKLDKWWRA